MHHSALLNVMIAAARKTARALKRDFGELEKLQVSLKGPANFVSSADRRAEETLYQELSKARPGYAFLGEEEGHREGADKSHRWIVDPLDGTTNFLHGIPQFAISIALEREDSVVAGLRRFGAAALDLAWVAAGRLDGYWERDLKPWDMAAGSILVREAGGFVSDCDGGTDMFETGHIVAGNEAIQKELLRALKEAGK